MKKIRLLDNNTINKIAAGEVVERPSSVVKELVENSIDANATSVTIEIQDGGLSLIRITDNGSGIPKAQAKTAFTRHATSKIENIEDLENVLSLGFRGEALASIASVAQVELQTKTADDETGTLIEINGEEVIKEQDIGCTEGTSIVVRNLFYNVPARRKFLKKPSTEGSYIADMVNKIALGHPEVSFKFINNNSVILHTSGNNDLKTAVFYVYGKDIAEKMIEVNHSAKDFKLTGLLGKPEMARANRTYENLFINGRFIKSDIISLAIEDAYKTRLMSGKFPVFVLNFTLPPVFVDVNVHPTKLEVRFNNDDEVYNFFYNAVINTFKDKVLIPETDWKSKNSNEVNEFIKSMPKDLPIQQEIKITEGKSSSFKDEAMGFIEKINPPVDEKKEDSFFKSDLLNKYANKSKVKEPVMEFNKVDATEKLINDVTQEAKRIIEKNIQYEAVKENKNSFFNNYKIVGQIFGTYWEIEQGNSIFIIDQHAAHERILFEELMNKFKTESLISQGLVQPIALNMTVKEKQVYRDNEELIKHFGFEVEEFGENAFALRTVPYIFKQPSNVGFFTDIIDMLSENNINSIYDTKLIAVATIACKAAVKANDKLDYQEAVALIEKLLKLENPFSCPHGRPTIIEMTKYELEKKFKRII